MSAPSNHSRLDPLLIAIKAMADEDVCGLNPAAPDGVAPLAGKAVGASATEESLDLKTQGPKPLGVQDSPYNMLENFRHMKRWEGQPCRAVQWC